MKDDEEWLNDYVQHMLLEIAEEELSKVSFVLKKEYIEIHRLEVYEKLEEYISKDLFSTFFCKLGQHYRFDAFLEELGALYVEKKRTTATTSEDYERALKRINEIMEEYM